MKKYLPDLISIILFIILSLAYFFPADIDGRILFQSDTIAGQGAGQEAAAYYQETGERTRWTGSLFSGMPTYQISPSYDSTAIISKAQSIYGLFLSGTVKLMFIMLLGFYILLRAFGLGSRISFLGSIMWAFSSYFLILISAGHIWKYLALAYIPPTIAGMVLSYRGKYLLGGLVFAIFTAFQVLSNHVQMSYYFIMVMLFLFVAYGVRSYRSHSMRSFLKATAVLAIAGSLGVLCNLSNLYHTYSYSKQTMRSQSELQTVQDSGNQSSGLDKDYITQWSYGIDETLTLLVPNFKGGASEVLSASSKAMEKANPRYSSLYGSLTQYYGDQPMTSGPVYVGAFVLMLFILGCFLIKGEVKWALLGATILSIMLAWGKNFMGLTDFFIDYVPMYNKFRAVSSILVVAEFTVPLMAILALSRILKEPGILFERKKVLMASLLLTAGLSLAIAVFPGAFTEFVTAQESLSLEKAASQGNIPREELGGIIAAISSMRQNLLTSDAWRSLLVCMSGALVLLLLGKGKLSRNSALTALAVLTLIDLWTVDKRFLNDSQFKEKDTREQTFAMTQTDKELLEDKDPDFRVLNFATNTFNENTTSYYHKSIGGYHAAKLRRYQELVEHCIQPQMSSLYQSVLNAGGDMSQIDGKEFQAINMLNAKYLIFPVSQDGQTIPLENPHAMGNAWFVDGIRYVDSADAELQGVQDCDLRSQAVVDSRFQASLGGFRERQADDSTPEIQLTAYKPNQVAYVTRNSQDGVAVFSEIYYPDGWKATIDGKPVPIARADYVLRALLIPKGEHSVVMTFDPDSIKVTEGIAYASIALLLLGLILGVLIQKRKFLNSRKMA